MGWRRAAVALGAVLTLTSSALAGDSVVALDSLPGWKPPAMDVGLARTHVALEIPEPAFVTGYYEPEIAARRSRSDAFGVPLYGPPSAELLHLTRAEIGAGALEGRAPVIAWVADPVDAFFLQVQGSGRLRMEDGSLRRVRYAGRNRHAYVSIGRRLVARGGVLAESLTADALKAWLRADSRRGRELMEENPSFIFFREIEGLDPVGGPIGAAGKPLRPFVSVAVDPAHWPYGTRFWLQAEGPGPDGRPIRFAGLVVAEDTGAAIRGRGRLDLFFGSGEEAGRQAGAMRARGRLFHIVPRGASGLQP